MKLLATMTKREILKEIRSILSATIKNHGEGIIVTASPDGKPHASWMGTIGNSKLSKILTLTSPDIKKVNNILQNPKVEWMFNDKNLETVIYLRGMARVVYELDEIELAWLSLVDKSKAHFLRYTSAVGMQFLIIETAIEEMEYTCPKDNIYQSINPPFR